MTLRAGAVSPGRADTALHRCFRQPGNTFPVGTVKQRLMEAALGGFAQAGLAHLPRHTQLFWSSRDAQDCSSLCGFFPTLGSPVPGASLIPACVIGVLTICGARVCSPLPHPRCHPRGPVGAPRLNKSVETGNRAGVVVWRRAEGVVEFFPTEFEELCCESRGAPGQMFYCDLRGCKCTALTLKWTSRGRQKKRLTTFCDFLLEPLQLSRALRR